MDDTGYSIEFVGDEWYSADGQEADEVRLFCDNGDFIANVYRHESGRYTTVEPSEVNDETLLYRDWKIALIDIVVSAGYDVDETADMIRTINS